MREPTQLTRPLQIGLAAYFLIFWGIAWVFAWPAISRYLATGQRNGAIVLITTFTVWTIAFALLAYGSLKRWRWAFWAYLPLLGLVVVAAIRGPNRTTDQLFSDLISGLIAAALLIASLVGLVRFGPWAMKTGSVTASPAPIGPPVSADGKWWWDGTAWRPQRRAWIKDWANESLVLAALGWFCFLFAFVVAPLILLMGLIGGLVALRKSPLRNRAIAGIVINALSLVLVLAWWIRRA